MEDAPPAQDATKDGAHENMVPEQDGQPPPVVDSTNPLTSSAEITTVDEKGSKPTSDGDKSGFLSTSFASLSGRRASRSSSSRPEGRPARQPSPSGDPETPIPENGKPVPADVPKKSPFDLQIFRADETSTPLFDIIAVHDLGETATDAWTDGVTTELDKSTKEPPERGKSTATGDITHTTMMSPSPASVTAPAAILELKGENTDSKTLVEASNKSLGVSEHDASIVKLSRKSRKGAPSSMDLGCRPTKEVNWVRDLLSHDIPRSRILAFSYQEPESHRKPFTEYVDRVAKGLIGHIERARADHEDPVPIVFIGYGFGGVIIQKAVELVLTGLRSPLAGESPTAVELADQTKHALPEKTSSTANNTAATKDTPAIRAQDIYQILLLDTPFPNDEPLFPANTNVRMCSIMAEIEDEEKDSRIINDVWKGFAQKYSKAYPRAPGKSMKVFLLPSPIQHVANLEERADLEEFSRARSRAMDVTWLHSQAKGRQTDGHASELVDDKLAVSDKIDVTLTSISTVKHRRLARIPDAQDYIYDAIRARIQSTLLFKGIYHRNTDVVFTILESKNLKILNQIKGNLTPLHAAAKTNPLVEDIVTKLINHMQGDILKRDDMGWIPLHHALETALRSKPSWQERPEFANTIRYLMRNMKRGDLDITDKKNQSPWDLLRCKPEHCVCWKDECLAAWIWELRDTLEPIAGPAIEDQEEGQAEFSPPAPGTTQHLACITTDGTVAEFYHAPNEKTGQLQECINLKTPSIYSMVYDPKYGCASILERSRRKEASLEFKCRWIHIPANNEQWVSDLFFSLGLCDDSMSDHRHDGLSVLNRYIDPHAKKYDIRKVQPRGQPTPDGPHMPTIVEEFPENSNLEKGATSSPPLVSRTLSGQLAAAKVSWGNLSPVKDMRGEKIVALFMPILGYESHEEWQSTAEWIRSESESARSRKPGRLTSFPTSNPEIPLLRAYLYPDEGCKPLHSRRTLDQYSYYMLKSTERRDMDQVVYRWAEKHRPAQTKTPFKPTKNASTPILMVDQLWLWVLPDGTVITSIPNTHKRWEGHNIRQLLSEDIENNKKRRAIQAPENLVSAVLKTCLSIMTRKGPSGVKLQECFQSSINTIAEDQAVAMEEFLATVDRLNKAPDPFKLTADIDSFSKVLDETKQLVEIVDIQDELDIIKSVLMTQKKVLEQLRGVVSSPDRPHQHSATPRTPRPVVEPSDPEKTPGNTAFKNARAVDQALRIVKDNIARIEEMINSTKRIPDGLKQLLEFKQQQASGWEARYAKKLSEQGKRQNTIMLIFTIVTIIFLPMSFIASFLAIGIKEFPKDEGSDETDWPLSTAASYLFGISIGVSVFILVAVMLWFVRIAYNRKKRRNQPPPDILSPGLSSGSEDDSDLEEGHEIKVGRRRARQGRVGIMSAGWRARRPQPAEDTESSDSEESEDSGDDDRIYSHLFGRWDWHSHIPGVRRLWEWKLYRVRRRTRHRMRHSQENKEWDYPLSRWRHGLASALRIRRKWRLVRRRQNKEKTDSDSDCGSEDEKAKDNERGAEHQARVRWRKRWAEGVVERVIGWAGLEWDSGSSSSGSSSSGSSITSYTASSVTSNGTSSSGGEAGHAAWDQVRESPLWIALTGKMSGGFRRRQKPADEEMGVVRMVSGGSAQD